MIRVHTGNGYFDFPTAIKWHNFEGFLSIVKVEDLNSISIAEFASGTWYLVEKVDENSEEDSEEISMEEELMLGLIPVK